MPYITEEVDAEILTKQCGVTVYYAYKDGDYNNPWTYWYEIGEDTQFDVRKLKNYDKSYRNEDIRTYHANLVSEAIAHGQMDQLLEKAGVHPRQYPQFWTECNSTQLKVFIREYNKYICGGNTKPFGFKEGWNPKTVPEFYENDFQEYLKEAPLHEISG